jgi:hypothetical protein
MELWAAMWAPDWIVAGSVSRTRSEVWDYMLKAWYNYDRNANRFYGKAGRKGITRDSAIKSLKRRGLKVIKVQVVPA